MSTLQSQMQDSKEEVKKITKLKTDEKEANKIKKENGAETQIDQIAKVVKNENKIDKSKITKKTIKPSKENSKKETKNDNKQKEVAKTKKHEEVKENRDPSANKVKGETKSVKKPEQPPKSHKARKLQAQLTVEEDAEGFSSPPTVGAQSIPRERLGRAQWTRAADDPGSGTPGSIPNRRPKQPSAIPNRSRGALRPRPKEKKEEQPAEVKQFSFPGHKILSGATVAGSKMQPQTVIIKKAEESADDGPRRWAQGLFQTSTLSTKLRLLRLLFIWVFFRVVNKQTAWLSEKLGIGRPDDADLPPRPRPEPGEKYVRVFHENSPNPIHMKVTPNMGAL